MIEHDKKTVQIVVMNVWNDEWSQVRIFRFAEILADIHNVIYSLDSISIFM